MLYGLHIPGGLIWMPGAQPGDNSDQPSDRQGAGGRQEGVDSWKWKPSEDPGMGSQRKV